MSWLGDSVLCCEDGCYEVADEAVTVRWRLSRIVDRVPVCVHCCQQLVERYRRLGHDVIGVSDAA